MAGIALGQGARIDGPREARSVRAAVGLCCALLSLAVGSAVLGAWLLRPLFRVDAPSLWLMKANTALCVVCASLGMLLLANERLDGAGHLRRLLGALVCVLGSATLVEYAAGIQLGLDELLVADPSPSFPGRMSPWTATTLLLLAAALLAHRAPRLDWVADVALFGAGALLQLIAAGYFYGVVELYGVDRLTRVSPQTLLCLAALWVALIAGRLGRGILAIAMRRTPGGAAVRLLLPVALLLPPVLGWIRLTAELQGIFTSTRTGIALFAVAQTVVLVALIYGFAFRLDAAEGRYVAERRRRQELERFVAICAWTGKVRWNGEWIRVEEYLVKRWGVQVTHGISDEAFQRMEEEIAALQGPESGRIGGG